LTENGRHENDEPSKLQGMKLTDHFAEHENDGPKMTAGREVADEQIEF